ncbi:MAG: toll/interleukin-1 receptor domain-containing protein [Prevotella sp.]|nr:toll/interleukin-1 receptor domain-containing protein [Prevotella sp.]
MKHKGKDDSRIEVFISYSRKDTFFADQIVEQLEQKGIRYFIDRKGIAGGAEFPEVLATAIMQSDIVLFLGSENSYASKFTNNEVQYAVSNKEPKSVLTYIIDGSVLPDALALLLSGSEIKRLEDQSVADLVGYIDKVLRFDEKKKKYGVDPGGICSSMFISLLAGVYLGFKTNVVVGIAAFFLGLIALLFGIEIIKGWKEPHTSFRERVSGSIFNMILMALFLVPVFWLWHATEYGTYLQDALSLLACWIILFALIFIHANETWLFIGSLIAFCVFGWLTWEGYCSYSSSLMMLAGCHILLWGVIIATHWQDAVAGFKGMSSAVKDMGNYEKLSDAEVEEIRDRVRNQINSK